MCIIIVHMTTKNDPNNDRAQHIRTNRQGEQLPIASTGVGSLHRAVVAVPDPSALRPYAERQVFFEVHTSVSPCAHLAKVLALVWGIETAHWCEHGGIYNIRSASEMARDCWAGTADSDGLYLFEIGAGGENGVGPGRVHYARAADVDCFVSPLLASRLQRVLWIVEALYADQDATDVLSRLRASK